MKSETRPVRPSYRVNTNWWSPVGLPTEATVTVLGHSASASDATVIWRTSSSSAAAKDALVSGRSLSTSPTMVSFAAVPSHESHPSIDVSADDCWVKISSMTSWFGSVAAYWPSSVVTRPPSVVLRYVLTSLSAPHSLPSRVNSRVKLIAMNR
jgi:hypothetical protein